MNRLSPTLWTLMAGFSGGLFFSLISAPLPWVLGSIFGVILLTRTNLPFAKLPRKYVNIARVIIGLAIGSQFSPDMLNDLAAYGVSLSFIPFYIAVVTAAGWLYFHYGMKLDKRTAFLCSTPGGIAELVLVGEDIKANVAQLALIQGIRILVVVYCLPFLAGNLKGQNIGAVKQFMPSLSQSDPFHLLLLGLIGFSGWWLLARLKLPGSPIIGPMVFSACLSLNGLLPQEPPDELFKGAQLLLGTSIGCVFMKYSMKDMLGTTLKSTGFLILLFSLTAGCAWAVSEVSGFSLLSALLAYAPGGQAETSIVAIALGENTGYVALHHLVRLFIIVGLIPLFARWTWRAATTDHA
ncbi:AbrB family transcriptional regulator [Terasakiella pusilla]|uniref:AbrB family transcriptional regulator n=1 Tax=Terasakiella pusilla TaxID=64973 RepID=UPI0012EC402E|nr:AbrB family transcriptional regulator [Terasakiella pusilla]